VRFSTRPVTAIVCGVGEGGVLPGCSSTRASGPPASLWWSTWIVRAI